MKTLGGLPQVDLIGHAVAPLKQGLHDSSAYVRRVAAVTCMKMHRLDPETVADHGLVNVLYSLIRDTDPIVVMNCVTSLEEILQFEGGIVINKNIAHYLLQRLEVFPLWCLPRLLKLLEKYKPKTDEESLDIMNLVDGYLSSNSPSVVVAALQYFLHIVQNMPQLFSQVYDRAKVQIMHFLGSGNPEMTLALLDFVETSLDTHASVFMEHYKSFFCKYNDPLFLKSKKIRLLPLVTNGENVREILNELSLYSSDVSESVVICSVEAIGKIARQHPELNDQCLQQILQLLQTNKSTSSIGHILGVLQTCNISRSSNIGEVMLVVESIRDNLEKGSRGRAALVWLLGQYGEHLESAPYILEDLISSCVSADERNQDMILLLLSATTKLFLKRPAECQAMLGTLFEFGMGTDDIDVQDRVRFYYVLLHTDPQMCKSVVLGEKIHEPGL